MIPFNLGNGVSGVVHEAIPFDDIENQQQEQQQQHQSGDEKEHRNIHYRSHQHPRLQQHAPTVVIHVTSPFERFLITFLVAGVLFLLFLNYIMYVNLQPHQASANLTSTFHHDHGENAVKKEPPMWLAGLHDQKNQQARSAQDLLGLDGVL